MQKQPLYQAFNRDWSRCYVLLTTKWILEYVVNVPRQPYSGHGKTRLVVTNMKHKSLSLLEQSFAVKPSYLCLDTDLVLVYFKMNALECTPVNSD